MPSIFDIFQSQLGDGQIDQIAKQIGADKSKTRDAIAMTLPTMIEALARQAEKQGGADKIHSQLNNAPVVRSTSSGSRSMLEQLGEILQQESPSGSSSGSASKSLPTSRPAPTSYAPAAPSPSPPPRSSGPSPLDIFGELFGSKQGKVADAVSKSSGIGSSQAGSLIEILGPLLSSTLAQQTQSGKISPRDLDGILKQDRARVQQSPGGSLIGKLLDQDGDGDFDMNDIIKIGMSMLFKK